MKTAQAAFAALLICLAGCSGRSQAPMPSFKIISAAPNATEILFALGLDKNIIGVSQQCNYPSRAQSKPKIGTFSRPNIELIASLKPDIVFTTGLEQDMSNEHLGKLGIKTFVIYPNTVEELYESILKVGKLTGSEQRAQAIVNRMRLAIGKVKRKASAVPDKLKKKFLIEVMDNPLIVAGPRSFTGQLGDIAGGINIAHDVERAYSKFSSELVIERDPDCIILGHMYRNKDVHKKVKQRLGWSKIRAVRDGHIFNDIDPDILLRPSPRTPQAIEKIFERLYER